MEKPEVMKDMRSDCPCEDIQYCPLEALLRTMPTRTLEQHKLVEKYKYILSEDCGRDVGWDFAYMMWADNGYASRFGQIYKDGMLHDELWQKIYEGQ